MNQILNFKTTPGHLCLTGCISDLFNYFGFEGNEGIIFALAEASQFYYKSFDLHVEKPAYGKVDLVIGGARYDISLMIDNIIKYFPIKIEKEMSFEREETKAFIERYIANQLPVLAFVSREHLGYMNSAFRNPDSHFINIVGCDWAENQLRVSDPYIPTIPVTTYEGSLAFDDYYKGILSSREAFKYELEFRQIAFIPQRPFTDKQLGVETLLEALKKTATDFFSELDSARGESIGLKGLERFLADVKEWELMDNRKMQSELFRDAHQKLSNFGGPVQTNKLFTDFSTYLASRAPNHHFLELSQCFAELSKCWSVIANLFGKYSFLGSNQIKGNICHRLMEVIQLEESTYRMIKGL